MFSTLRASILNAAELAEVSGGYVDWETDWCGTKVPGWPRPKTAVDELLNEIESLPLRRAQSAALAAG